MKHIITLFIASIITFFSEAQQIEISGAFADEPYNAGTFTKIDDGSMACIYKHTITDTINVDVKTGITILQIGNDFSCYSAYGGYRVDSVIINRKIAKITIREYSNLESQYNSAEQRADNTTIIKDKKQNRLNVYDKVFIDYYTYSEPVPDFNWSLSNGTSTICGYECKKATCYFRGRQWTAWYTEDIPVDNGPWKFSGLPGLILRIEDSNAEHIFTAISIRNTDYDIHLRHHDYLKTTRERFNAELKDYKENARQYIAGSIAAPKNADGTSARIPKRRMFFNPIELE